MMLVQHQEDYLWIGPRMSAAVTASGYAFGNMSPIVW